VAVNCKVCHEETQDDGYGEKVHLDTGLYGVYDHKGQLTHVAV
jgi:hypothetical protein